MLKVRFLGPFTYFGIPQESFEVAQNPRQTRDKSGKQVCWEKDTLSLRVFFNSTNIPFFLILAFWHPKRVTRHYRQKVPFLRVFLVARVYSQCIVEWPPPGKALSNLSFRVELARFTRCTQNQGTQRQLPQGIESLRLSILMRVCGWCILVYPSQRSDCDQTRE